MKLRAEASFFENVDSLVADGTRVGALETRGTDEVRWTYEYDHLTRLTRERRGDGNDGSWERDVSYTYDGDGNRTREINHVVGPTLRSPGKR